MNIPIAHSVESLERFMEHIKVAPVPRQVSVLYLKKAGFRTGNDPELRHIFRLLGFLDENGVPLKRWRAYKTEGRPVLRVAVEECYRDLFNKFPDPANRTDEDLERWFRPPVTGDSKTSIIRAIRTFRKLCLIARITPPNKLSLTVANKTAAKPRLDTSIEADQKNIDKIPLIFQLPLSSDQSDYERVFKAFKKVFYS